MDQMEVAGGGDLPVVPSRPSIVAAVARPVNSPAALQQSKEAVVAALVVVAV